MTLMNYVHLLITEGIGTGCVRVFLDRDYNYGMFIDEAKLINHLNGLQRLHYAKGQGGQYVVSEETAEMIKNDAFYPNKD